MKYMTVGIFRNAPLPWRYDATTRNVLASDGMIVCRCGDEVYADPEIGGSIVKCFNARYIQPEITSEESLLAAIEGSLDGMAKDDLVLTCQTLTNGRAAWMNDCKRLLAALRAVLPYAETTFAHAPPELCDAARAAIAAATNGEGSV